jgi:hypothetical protein
MAVPIHFAARDHNGRITHVGGIGPRNTTWQLTKAEVVQAIEGGTWVFFTQGPMNKPAVVRVQGDNLVSAPDGVSTNNLDNLPPLVSPMGGGWPSLPMSFPSLVSWQKLLVHRARVVTNGPDRVVERPAIYRKWGYYSPDVDSPAIYLETTDRHSGWISLDINLPLLSPVQVQVTSVFNAAYLFTSLKQVSSDIRRDLAADEFYVTEGPSFASTGEPDRLNEMRVVCGIPDWAWQDGKFAVQIYYSSLNPYARELYPAGLFVVPAVLFLPKGYAPATPPIVPLNNNATVPDCIGLTLKQAEAAVVAAGLQPRLSSAALFTPNITDNSVVIGQSPVAGTGVRRASWVDLTPTQDASVVRGVKTVRFHNQCQQQRPLQLWINDITSGQWSDKGAMAFGGAPISVDFADGHQFAIFAADYALNGCRPDTNRPPDLCIYKSTGPVLGDKDGDIADIVIT